MVLGHVRVPVTVSLLAFRFAFIEKGSLFVVLDPVTIPCAFDIHRVPRVSVTKRSGIKIPSFGFMYGCHPYLV